ncbi:hypothetical protein JTB14_010381 [Gonioctena quinquepunctata]|nr:hypothetical protein JTB14_010381 [Gonioctena quinquepunctata]
MKDLKLIFSTPETHFKIVEIELTPNKEKSFTSPKARVTVDGKEGKISERESYDVNDGFIHIYALPNGKIKVEVRYAGYIIYDGYRARLTSTSSKFRGSLRGLCGQFNSQNYEEFLTYENCFARDPKKFIKSLEVEGQEGQYDRSDYPKNKRMCRKRDSNACWRNQQ